MEPPVTAAARCPIELWMEIIQWATYVPPCAFNPSRVPQHIPGLFRRLCDSGREGSIENAEERGYGDEPHTLGMRIGSGRRMLPVALSLVLVCRSWYEIAEPYLYEAISITDDELPRPGMILRALAKTRHGAFAGAWVRRLHIIQSAPLNSSPERDEGERRGWRSKLTALIGYCSRLSEFVWEVQYLSVYDIIPALAISCAETLSLLILDQTAMVGGRFAALATQFPRLEVLSVGVIDMRDQPTSPLVSDSDRFHHLRTLSVSSQDKDGFFRDFLSHLRLPHLRHVDVSYDWSLQYSPHFFQAHGSKLLSLSLEVGPPSDTYALPPENAGLVSSLLDCCPNLEELVFDLHTSIMCPSTPLLKLRSIAFKAFICHLYIAPERHISAVKAAFDVFASPHFPNLQLIRCVDVLKRLDRIRPHHSRWGLDPEYVKLVDWVREKCASRGIRLEDCAGGPMTKDIEPLYPPLARQQI